MDVVEETVVLPGGELIIERPRDTEALLDDEAFESQDEFMPYWAELWPASVALARALATRPLGNQRVLELGCGLGVASLAAARNGADVLATDWAPEALEFLERNAARNALTLTTAVVDWREPQVLLDAAPWDLVLASDVTYEARNVKALLELLPRLGREIWVADPGREQSAAFMDGADRIWQRRSTIDIVPPHVSVHRFTPVGWPGGGRSSRDDDPHTPRTA